MKLTDLPTDLIPAPSPRPRDAALPQAAMAADAAGPRPRRAPARAMLAAWSAAMLLGACGGGGGGGGAASAVDPPAPPEPPAPPVVITPVDGPAWSGFGRDAQHSALGEIATQPLSRVVWRTPVDLAPVATGGDGALLAHYGSPVITRRNTVVLPVKTSRTGDFRLDARIGQTGGLMWSLPSDYRLPPAYNWVPSYNPTLTADGRIVAPAAGGRVLMREAPDEATGSTRTLAFYGNAAYDAAPASFDATVFINTPITADRQGNLYFGFTVSGSNPAGLSGGIARVAADGSGRWVAASTATGDAAIVKTAMNSAPALSIDEGTLYVVVNTAPAAPARARGQLLALDAATLAVRARAPLLDPATGTPAWVNDNATSSPMVGPDGAVFIGVLEADPPSHNFRGWLLQFDGGLMQTRTPASFGWDNTPSVVPVSMLPSYSGPSSYLLALKYNSYGGIGTGDGQHRVAIVDPRQTQPDPFAASQGRSVTVMRDIISVLGITPDTRYAGGVREWCINTAAVDPQTQSVLMNSEDGYLYRWHLPSNTLSERLSMNNGYAQSYTPTAIGPDGRVYAVNNATLFSIGR